MSFLLTSLAAIVFVANAEVTVRYFDSRGRAEAIRLTLSALEIDFNEIKYDRCGDKCSEGFMDWPTAKAAGLKDGTLPFGQVPSITYHGETLVQSMAILRYICRENEREPDFDIAYDVDVFVGGYNDLRGKYGKMVYDSTIHDKDSTKIKDYQDTARVWLGYLESLLTHGKFVGGAEDWSYADILAFEVMDMNLRANSDIDGSKEYPLLMEIARKVVALPGVTEYLKSNGRRPNQNGNSAHFDNPTHTVTPFDWLADMKREL